MSLSRSSGVDLLTSSMLIVLLFFLATPSVYAQSNDPDLADLEALYFQRIQDSRMRFVQADVDFMTHMIPHHAQALIMSRLAPENGASRQVQTLAARIINAQADEIRTMQTWLRDRNQPVPIIHIDGLIMTVEMEMPKPSMDHAKMSHNSHDHSSNNTAKHTSHEGHNNTAHAGHTMSGHSDTTQPTSSNGEMDHNTMDHSNMGHGSMNHDAMDHSDMPGMLTQEELEHLASVHGVEFDRAFLTYMIGHHMGAVIMVNDLFAADGAGTDHESYRLAVDIYAEQVTEIEMMRLMLQEIGPMQTTAPTPGHHQHH